MSRWHITRKWRKLDSLRALWGRITFRPRLAFDVLFRYKDISILHNYDVTRDGTTSKRVQHRYVTHCYFELKK